jgi:hypothetical protein
MQTARRIALGIMILTFAMVGCRTSSPAPAPSRAVYSPPPPPLTLPTSAVSSPVQVDLSRLPRLNPLQALPPVQPTEYQPIHEQLVQVESAKRATVTTLLRSDVEPQSAAGQQLRELQRHLADEASNRAALNALEQYFQLADVEGRATVMRRSLPVLDELRKTVKESRDKGLQVPVELDELERQRATLLGLMNQAEMGGQLLEIDLKRRLGIDGKSKARLQPLGPFPVVETTLNTEELVQVALETRADLRLLRSAYHGLTPETLPSVRQLLQERAGIPNIPTGPRFLTNKTMNLGIDMGFTADLEVRRQQLADLILERERSTADEVRAAAATFSSQTQLVALARWRAESLNKKSEEQKNQGMILPKLAQIEVFRAEADLITSVMTWHQARVRLNAAQGLYSQRSDGNP